MKKIRFLTLLILIITVIFMSVGLTGCKKEQTPTSSETVSDTDKASSDTDTSTDTSTSSEDSSSDQTDSSEEIESTPPPSTPTPSSTPSTPSNPITPTPSAPETPAKKTPKELIVGKWSGQYDFANDFAQYELEGNTVGTVYMEFTSSGTYITTIDSATFKNLLRPALLQEFENKRIEAGKSPEDFEQGMMQKYGMTTAQHVEEILESFNQGWNVETEYKFAGDTLLVKDPTEDVFIKCQYEFPNDNTLITIEENIRTTYTRIK